MSEWNNKVSDLAMLTFGTTPDNPPPYFNKSTLIFAHNLAQPG